MSRPACSPAGEHGPGGGASAGAAIASLDPAAIASLRELDPGGRNQLLQRVCSAFRVSTERLLPQMLESRRRGELDGVRVVAHTLKSSSASVGAKALAALCAEVEGRIRDGTVEGISARVDLLHEEVVRTLAALDALQESGR